MSSMNSLQLANVFQSGAVVQRDCPLPVWGWAPASRRVRVTLAGAVANSWVSAWGDFRVVLPPLPTGGPYALRVELPDAPDFEPLVVEDVWIGEVWLASGQSNMQWTLGECGPLGAAAVEAANDPLLRFFTVERRAELAPQRDVGGRWQAATPEAAPGFSAVAYHFARRLRAELDVPVGVIVSAWGGTPIEAWLPRRAHAASPLLRNQLAFYENRAFGDARWAETGEDGALCYPADPGIRAEAAAWAAADEHDTAWPSMEMPATWQRHGHGYSGVFWFRKRVTIPAAWVGRDLCLEPGALDKQDVTFVNGTEVGRTGKDLEESHWCKPRVYTVPAACVTTREILIAIRVYSFAYDGGMLGPVEQMRLSCPEDGGVPLSLAGEWRYQVEHNLGPVTVSGAEPGHLAHRSPYILYDNMIAPLAGCGLRGMLWYQGESNAAHPAEYQEHLRSLISAWRAAWELGELPFLIVQLPGFGLEADFAEGSNWARMRQGQLNLLRDVPGTGLAVTIDCGEANDIHPVNKEPVGHRLAQWALVETYGQPCPRSGPLATSATRIAAGRVRVTFASVGSGLATVDGQMPNGFYFLDDGERARAASAEIDGESLLLSCETCPAPREVAYAWADFPLNANLCNRERLPASPFRCGVEGTA